jgi:predicted DNA-binding transcriptional regulator YafY
MSTESTLRLVGELLAGRNIGRAEAARILATEVAAADAQLRSFVRLLPVERFKSRGQVFYRWKRNTNAHQRAVPTSTIMAGYFASSLARLFDGTIYEPGMRDVADTLLAVSGASRRFENADRQFVFVVRGGEIALPAKEGLLSDLLQLLQDSHRAKLLYKTGGGRRVVASVQPLSIAIYDHQLYLVARRTDGSFHPFRFARIERVARLPQRAPYPSRSEYDPDQLFRDSIGIHVDERFPVRDVELIVSNRWKGFMDSHRWHRSQKLDPSMGGALLRMRVRTCPELTRWILGFGAEATVVKPASLRKSVARTVAQMNRRYMTKNVAQTARARSTRSHR